MFSDSWFQVLAVSFQAFVDDKEPGTVALVSHSLS